MYHSRSMTGHMKKYRSRLIIKTNELETNKQTYKHTNQASTYVNVGRLIELGIAGKHTYT